MPIVNTFVPVTEPELAAVMPGLAERLRVSYLPDLNAALREFDISSLPRKAAFLSQVAVTSHDLTVWTPFLDYETGRATGGRFRPRGPLRIAGRDLYARAAAQLGIDLVTDPELAIYPPAAFRVAAWLWKGVHQLNRTADRLTCVSACAARDQAVITLITRRLCGDARDPSPRIAVYARALAALRARHA